MDFNDILTEMQFLAKVKQEFEKLTDENLYQSGNSSRLVGIKLIRDFGKKNEQFLLPETKKKLNSLMWCLKLADQFISKRTNK